MMDVIINQLVNRNIARKGVWPTDDFRTDVRELHRKRQPNLWEVILSRTLIF